MPPPLIAAARFGIDFRPLTEDDLPFTAALYASTRADEVAATGWPPEQQAAFLAHQHAAQHRHYKAQYPDAEWLVIERAGQPIGRLYLAQDAAAVLVVDIALISAERGAGIGEALLRDVGDWARSLGKRVSIHVEKYNPARRLYDRLGFVAVEDKGVYDRMEWQPEG